MNINRTNNLCRNARQWKIIADHQRSAISKEKVRALALAVFTITSLAILWREGTLEQSAMVIPLGGVAGVVFSLYLRELVLWENWIQKLG